MKLWKENKKQILIVIVLFALIGIGVYFLIPNDQSSLDRFYGKLAKAVNQCDKEILGELYLSDFKEAGLAQVDWEKAESFHDTYGDISIEVVDFIENDDMTDVADLEVQMGRIHDKAVNIDSYAQVLIDVNNEHVTVFGNLISYVVKSGGKYYFLAADENSEFFYFWMGKNEQ